MFLLTNYGITKLTASWGRVAIAFCGGGVGLMGIERFLNTDSIRKNT